MSDKIKSIITVCIAATFLFGLSIWNICKPDDTQSVSERRPLATAPQLSINSVLTGKFMTDFEKYAPDQFPLRDNFRTIKAFTVLSLLQQKDNNDIYIKDGYAVKIEYPYNSNSITHAAERFNYVYEKYLKDSNSKIFLSVIPDKNYWQKNNNSMLTMDYDSLFAELQQKMDYAEYIDITNELSLFDYYKTDTHWRQEKLENVATYIANKMNVSLNSSYSPQKSENDFYGVYYGQAALPLKADEIIYLTNDTINNCKVYDYETNSFLSVYDLEKLNSNDAYEVFLSGSKSLLTITNPLAKTEKELIMFRDSFGSSLAPLLIDGYKKITLVDIRYISPALLGQFIDFSNSDVLFIYSTSVLNNSITIK